MEEQIVTAVAKEIQKMLEEAIKEPTISVDDIVALTKTLYMALVKINGSLLYEVPARLRTYEICMAAVKKDGRALIEVPEIHRDNEMCTEAVKNNGSALGAVPDRYRTFELAKIATINYPDAYTYYHGTQTEKEALRAYGWQLFRESISK